VFIFQRVSDLSVSIIHFKVEDTVKNLKGGIEELIPNYRDVIETTRKDFLEPVVTGTNKEATTQTAQPVPSTPASRLLSRSEGDEYDDPFRIGQPRRGIGVGFDPHWYANFDCHMMNGSAAISNIEVDHSRCLLSSKLNSLV
jgi:hypothetical protein